MHMLTKITPKHILRQCVYQNSGKNLLGQLSTYALSLLQVMFEAVLSSGTVGDIAVDDLTFTAGDCQIVPDYADITDTCRSLPANFISN